MRPNQQLGACDRRDHTPGMPWVRELEKALNTAKAAIILIGPRGLGNVQQYERDLAIYRQTRDPSFPIVPVILPEAAIGRRFNFLQVLTWIGSWKHLAAEKVESYGKSSMRTWRNW
jgi:hypothetical protein